jgi:hypothetical protein
VFTHNTDDDVRTLQLICWPCCSYVHSDMFDVTCLSCESLVSQLLLQIASHHKFHLCNKSECHN